MSHIISTEGIAVDLEKVEKVLTFLFPATLTILRAFLGLVGYYRRFILEFSHNACPLTTYLKKGIISVVIFTDEKAVSAFEELKLAITKVSVLKMFEGGKPFILYTNISSIALGCTLRQEDESGFDDPITYVSGQLMMVEKNYSVIDGEGLTMIYYIKKIGYYILGNKFTIVTDHKTLKYIFNKPNAQGRIARGKLLLQEFDYEILDRSNKKYINIDALSKVYDDERTIPVVDSFPDEALMVLTSILEEYSDIWKFLHESIYPKELRQREKPAFEYKCKPYTIIEEVLFHQGCDRML